jgi:6-phosphogluconolactonase
VQLSTAFIVDAGRQALSENDRFVMALSGGSTPRAIYQALPVLWNKHDLEWGKVHILWSDERCVPFDDPESNYRMASETLLDAIDIPGDHVHPMHCDEDPAASADRYEETLRALFPEQAWPSIDLVLLGIGADGHTASLFPGTVALSERTRWVVENKVPGADAPRMTLTFPAINAARRIAFLVAGSGKADVVHKILIESKETPSLPAGKIKPSAGELHWLLDGDSAKRLKRS